MNQKQAAYTAITSVLKEKGIAFEDGMDVAPLMTTELRGIVNQMLVAGFAGGQIELSRGPFTTEQELKSYVSGLQSNWIRKDTRLNGGGKYEPKNPGSRTGSSDEQLKALVNLRSTLPEGTDRDEVDAFIEIRKTELAKSKIPVIDFSKLPDALKSKYSK